MVRFLEEVLAGKFVLDFCWSLIDIVLTGDTVYISSQLKASEQKKTLIAGNFLEIKGLVKLMVKAVALQIQGKPVEEIRKTFQIEDPKWSAEELQKLKDENAWAYETKK